MINYIKRIAKELTDTDNLYMELMVGWGVVMVTGIFILMVLGMIATFAK